MAIPPGEPADLILEEWKSIYKALCRDKFVEYIKDHNDLKEAKKYVKSLKKLKSYENKNTTKTKELLFQL